MENRLYRSKTDVILGGVCSGLGKYLHIDPTLVRLFFIIITLAGGVGVLAYIILWIVVPEEETVAQTGNPEVLTNEGLKNRAGEMRDEFVDAVRKPNPNAIKLIGIGLVLYGGYLILKELHLPWLSWLSNGVVWAIVLIAVGILLVLRVARKD